MTMQQSPHRLQVAVMLVRIFSLLAETGVGAQHSPLG